MAVRALVREEPDHPRRERDPDRRGPPGQTEPTQDRGWGTLTPVPDRHQLIVDNIPQLRRYALALVGDKARADDLVQDCLERAWPRRQQWQEGTNMRAWLFTILHSVYANAARKHSREPQLAPLDDGAPELVSRATQGDQLELRALEMALADLPEAQRAAVLLVGLEDLAYADAAMVLDIPIGTLMSRLHRGRERLRELLA